VTAANDSAQDARTTAESTGDGAEDFDAFRVRVLAEIDEEVRRRRASGDLTPSFEQLLHQKFERLSPTSTEGGYFSEALKLADHTAYIDAEPPLGSNFPGGEMTKRALHRLLSWYLGYLTQQVTQFTSATIRTLHLLDDRVSDLERQARSGDAAQAGSMRVESMADTKVWAELVGQRLAGLRGRVLHAECGDGTLLRALTAAHVDAYGVDPRATFLDAAASSGFDVRLEGGLEHLKVQPESSLGGLVLSGFVDHLALGDQRELVTASARALRIGGTIAIVGTNPDAWTRVASPVAIDLSPGRPLHAETWSTLLEQQGISSIEVHHQSREDGLQPVAGEGPPWEALRSNLARLGDLLFTPTSFVVVGVRQR